MKIIDIFENEIGSRSPGFLRDHRVHGMIVMPGAGYVEMVISAGREVWGNIAIEIRDFSIEKALIIGEEETRVVQLVLEVEGEDGGIFRILSRHRTEGQEEKEWSEHASGRVLRGVEEAQDYEVAEVRGRCAEELQTKNLYSAFRKAGLDYRGGFEAIKKLYLSKEEAIGELDAGISREYSIHPALLDGCFQVATLLNGAEGKIYLPIGIERFIYYRKPEGKVWSYAHGGEVSEDGKTRTVDIWIKDSRGMVAIVGGLTLREAEEEAFKKQYDLRAHNKLTYEIAWLERGKEKECEKKRKWIVCGEAREERAGEIRKLGEEVSAEYSTDGEEELIEVVYFARGNEYWRVLEEARRVGKRKGARLAIVTMGAQRVEGGETVEGLEASPIWGLGKVLDIEMPKIECLRIDVDGETPLETILREIKSGRQEREIGYRRGKRYVRRLVRRELPVIDAKKKIIVEEGAYLITGGLTGIGLKVAEWLVGEGARDIVLMGRREASEEAQKAIDAMQALGARVCVESADVSKIEEVERVLKVIRMRKVPLKGVVHSAGVFLNARISNQTEEGYEEVAAPKVLGSWNLHKATAEDNLDFFIMFSSIGAVFGYAGQANYAAANAYMDALAEKRRAEGLPGLSINWGPWETAGRLSELGEKSFELIMRGGEKKISSQEALETLKRILIGGESNIAVVPVDWKKFELPDSQVAFFEEVGVERKYLGEDSGLIKRLKGLAESERAGDLKKYLQEEAAKVLGFKEKIDPSKGLMTLGMDSLIAVEFRNRLKKEVGEKYARLLPATLIFNHPTIEALTKFLAEEVLGLDSLGSVLNLVRKKRHSNNEPIAVIGMSCRFPGGANSPEEFWRVLDSGTDTTREIPKERFDIDEYYNKDPNVPGTIYLRKGSFIDGIENFDPSFFNISQGEAIAIDPQQRLFLEASFEALRSAGESLDDIVHSQTGVYAGVASTDYCDRLVHSDLYNEIERHAMGAAATSLPARVAFFLRTCGPAIAVDTSCASSLSAIHLAVQGLRSGECDRALAGGVNVILSPRGFSYFSRTRMLSISGTCRVFDEAADGYIRGEGCGVLVLKRLSDAKAKGDRIIALIRGTAAKQSGARTSMSAPNGLAQEAVINEALLDAGVLGKDVSYVEAYGIGSPVIDAIEMQSLEHVFGSKRKTPLVIGSVKTNIGHAEAAAGIAGVIKTILAMQHERIPKHLHFEKLNPDIKINAIIPVRAIDWNRGKKPRIAGVSSFGLMGTNAHVILEEAPISSEITKSNSFDRPIHIFTLSGKTKNALKEFSHKYEKYLLDNDEILIADLVAAASVVGPHLEERLAITVKTFEELKDKIRRFNINEPSAEVHLGRSQRDVKLAFVFNDRGSEYFGMGKELYETERVFRSNIDKCAEVLKKYLDVPLLDILFKNENLLTSLRNVRPAIFAIGYSMSEMWKDWGVRPQAVVGSGLGQITASVVAGAIDLEQGLMLATQSKDVFIPATKVNTRIVTSAHELLLDGYNTFLEIGPGHNSELVQIVAENGKAFFYVFSTIKKNMSDWEQITEALAALYVRGHIIDWRKFYKEYLRGNRLQLPAYPFQRERYWIEANETKSGKLKGLVKRLMSFVKIRM